jgi:L-amino acid N-acyltransferase YncA
VIELRTVETEADIDLYLEIRNRVHPDLPMPLKAVLAQRRRPGNLDVIAELDGVAAGAMSVDEFGGAPSSGLAFMTIRVLREARRRGVGTALYARASEHARFLGKSEAMVMARHVDEESLAYYPKRGFEERGRMQVVELELATAHVEVHVPDGIEIVLATEEHDRAVHAVALESMPDIPTAEPMEAGELERWRARFLGDGVLRDCSFLALDHGRVVGFAILGLLDDETGDHWLTGVARSARGKGVALALKQAQIVAAKESGLHVLRGQNDLANAAMRRVNEKLGYQRRFEWVHLVGPLHP